MSRAQAKLAKLAHNDRIAARIMTELEPPCMVDIAMLGAKWGVDMSEWAKDVRSDERMELGFETKRIGRHGLGRRALVFVGPGAYATWGSVSEKTLYTQSQFDAAVGPSDEKRERARRWIGRELATHGTQVQATTQKVARASPRDTAAAASRAEGNVTTPSSGGRRRRTPGSGITLQRGDGVSRQYLLHEWDLVGRGVCSGLTSTRRRHSIDTRGRVNRMAGSTGETSTHSTGLDKVSEETRARFIDLFATLPR